MIYNYDFEFQNAIENTIKVGVNIDNYEPTNKRYFTQNIGDFSNKIISTLLWLKEKKKIKGQPEFIPLLGAIIGNCGPFHNYMKPIIEQAFNCKSFLTLGYIKLTYNDMEETTYHKFELTDIERSINSNGIFSHNHHIWLTLDSGEILDMTFLMTYKSINDKNFYKTVVNEGIPFEFVTRHYSELPKGMEYKPMFVGDEVLNKAGYNIKSLTNIVVWDSYPENI
ncbi:hypothetical protein [Sulfurospirillum barnesii]|uniref:Uncharacterized protein n=1 Tax=Sulfurospirillum barnesii (strain ATCC 700032 / DSM 10660 / SES-3) TaxID=760154 RepID=I3XVD6_SULBS|nr:hypothetical protein [Sulfurospirillum barnesii]AFL67910.1 hypothetical protein Sulba_0602 [Sulfurospirillum barnesii SES-3]